jgi:hypothetical protein
MEILWRRRRQVQAREWWPGPEGRGPMRCAAVSWLPLTAMSIAIAARNGTWQRQAPKDACGPPAKAIQPGVPRNQHLTRGAGSLHHYLAFARRGQLLTLVLTTAMDTGGRPWTPRCPDTSSDLLRRSVVDSCVPGNPEV